MIRISQLRLPCGYPEGALENKIRKSLRTGSRPLSCKIVRHSVDARKKPQLFDMYTVDVDTGLRPGEEAALIRRLKNKNIRSVPAEDYRFPAGGTKKLSHRPVVIGAGPAGLFCALFLAEHGYRPLLIERGRKMEERTKDVERFWETGVLDTASNVQFGEGGAGTFSDGKLNTQINDRTGRSSQVLRIFVEAGAPESILYEGKPHIGTDRLREVIPRIRRRIEEAGGEVRFETVCTGFSFADVSGEPAGSPKRRLSGLYVRSAACREEEKAQNSCRSSEKEDWIPAEAVVFAVGHSARDTIEELYREKIPLEQKQFAVGFRVAHPQSMIDQSQYGVCDPAELDRLRLSASPYKLTARASSGRGVYSFCMCPGGYIVNASSEEGRICVNGMSDEGRDSGWANSAIVITVGQKEFGSSHVLAGMEFQRELEKRARDLGGGAVPVQKYTDLRDCFFNEHRSEAAENNAEKDKVQEGRPEEGRPEENRPEESRPEESRPEESRPEEGRPEESRPEVSRPEESRPEESRSDQCKPEITIAEKEKPEGTVTNPEEETLSLEAVKGACRPAALHRLLPADMTADFIEGMEQFGNRIRGFDGPQGIVAGIESRTSSPVRIPRAETFESTGAAGLYPCGEGAGYAGGIMSAAMDGIRIAEAIAGRFAPFSDQDLF